MRECERRERKRRERDLRRPNHLYSLLNLFHCRWTKEGKLLDNVETTESMTTLSIPAARKSDGGPVNIKVSCYFHINFNR